MPNDKLRRQIAFEAARLIYARAESELFRARTKAARRICPGAVRPSDLPTQREIRDQIQSLARAHQGNRHGDLLGDLRIEALRWMYLLRPFRPRLVGGIVNGQIRHGSQIELHLFGDDPSEVTAVLDAEAVAYDVERKSSSHNGRERFVTLLHVRHRIDIEITLYAAEMAHRLPSSLRNGPIERASISQLEQILAEQDGRPLNDAAPMETQGSVDRFQVYYLLLLPLEGVKQKPQYHPEGDALYHSLQVFELARDALPYDEEFQLAALLHDVGKAIDPHDHIAAGLEALQGHITPRTAWLIEHHADAGALRDGKIGARSRRRLQASEDFENLMLLCDCDRRGRRSGVEVPELEDALEDVRELARTCGEG